MIATQAGLTFASAPQPRQWTARELTELAKRVEASGDKALASFIRPDFRAFHPDSIVPMNDEARAMLEGIDPR